MRWSLELLSLLIMLLPACGHGGHGGGGSTREKDLCVRKSGESPVHLTIYAPDLDPSAEYCGDVPQTGSMVVVFDLADIDMRKVPVAIDIVSAGDAPRETVHHVDAKIYPTGVVNTEVRLASPGRYAAVLTPEGRPVVTFPMRVGMQKSILVWVVPLLLVGSLLFYWSQRRRSGASAAAPPPKRTLALVK